MQAFQPFVEQAGGRRGPHLVCCRFPWATAYTSFYTTRQFLARDPESLLRMTRAMYRTQQWIVTHSAAELAASVAAFSRTSPGPR